MNNLEVIYNSLDDNNSVDKDFLTNIIDKDHINFFVKNSNLIDANKMDLKKVNINKTKLKDYIEYVNNQASLNSNVAILFTVISTLFFSPFLFPDLIYNKVITEKQETVKVVNYKLKYKFLNNFYNDNVKSKRIIK